MFSKRRISYFSIFTIILILAFIIFIFGTNIWVIIISIILFVFLILYSRYTNVINLVFTSAIIFSIVFLFFKIVNTNYFLVISQTKNDYICRNLLFKVLVSKNNINLKPHHIYHFYKFTKYKIKSNNFLIHEFVYKYNVSGVKECVNINLDIKNTLSNFYTKNIHSLIFNKLIMNIDNKQLSNIINNLNINYIFCLSAIHFGFLSKIFSKFHSYKIKILIKLVFIMLLLYLCIIRMLKIPLLRFLIFFCLNNFLYKNNKCFWKYINNLFLTLFIILIICSMSSIFSLGFLFSFGYSFLILYISQNIKFLNSFVQKFLLWFYITLFSIIIQFMLFKFVSIWMIIASWFILIIVEYLLLLNITMFIYTKNINTVSYQNNKFYQFLNLLDNNNYLIKTSNIYIIFFLILIFISSLFIFFFINKRSKKKFYFLQTIK